MLLSKASYILQRPSERRASSPDSRDRQAQTRISTAPKASTTPFLSPHIQLAKKSLGLIHAFPLSDILPRAKVILPAPEPETPPAPQPPPAPIPLEPVVAPISLFPPVSAESASEAAPVREPSAPSLDGSSPSPSSQWISREWTSTFSSREAVFSESRSTFEKIRSENNPETKELQNLLFLGIRRSLNQITHSLEKVNAAVVSVTMTLLRVKQSGRSDWLDYAYYFLSDSIWGHHESWTHDQEIVQLSYVLLSQQREHPRLLECFVGLLSSQGPALSLPEDSMKHWDPKLDDSDLIDRLSLIFRFYCFLLVDPPYSNLRGLGLSEAWTWLSRFLNLLPSPLKTLKDLHFSLLAVFLSVLQVPMQQQFGEPYKRVRQAISDRVLAEISRRGIANAFVTRLRESFNSQLSPPEYYDTVLRLPSS